MSTTDLIFELTWRLDGFRASGGVLTDAEGLAVEDRLYYAYDWMAPIGGAVVSLADAVVAALVLAETAWARLTSPGQPGATGQDDLMRAGWLFQLVHAVLPERVPSPLRAGYTRTPHPYSPGDLAAQVGFAVGLLRDHERTGAVEPLDAAIVVLLFTRDLAAARSADAHRSALASLGAAYTRKFELTRDHRMLTAATLALAHGGDGGDPADSGWSARLSNLGHAHIRKYDADGDPGDLDTAAGLLREAVATARTDVHRAVAHTNLAAATTYLFLHREQAALLDEALAAVVAAVDLSERDDPDLPSRLASLGNVLRLRARHLDDRADTVDVLGLYRRAVALSEGPYRWLALTGLTSALAHRFEETGEPELLAEAATAGAAAVAETGPRRHEHPAALLALAEIRGLQGDRSGAGDLLARAERLTGDTHPLRTTVLVQLGAERADSFAATGDEPDRLAAIGYFVRAAGLSGAPALNRAHSAARAASLHADAGEHAEAVAAFATALDLLDLALWGGLSPDDHERLLATAPALANDAAACALLAGDPRRSVELLEQGRGILLARAAEVPVDRERVHEAAPEVAGALAALQAGIDAAGTDPARRAELAARRDELIGEVRAVEGLADFLRAPGFDTLCAAAGDGPVVLVNLSRRRSDALIVRTTGVVVVPLPELTAAAVEEHVVAYLGALRSDPGDGQDARLAARSTVLDTLAWLWTSIAAPVFAHLATDGEPIRLWWCPTSFLALLPLHAAGRYTAKHGPPVSALDHAVSSYTPTLRALARARARPRPGTRDRSPLVICAHDVPGWPHIPNALEEVRAVTDRLPGNICLIGPRLESVVAMLARHDRAHIVCHGAQDLTATSRGGLVFHDGVLTARDVLAHRGPPGELAVLSACVTAQTTLRAANEAMSFAAVLQQSAFRHVVGTLTAVGDTAPEFADAFYANLAETGDVPHALHRTVQALRARYPWGAGTWAPYVHFGPG